MTSKLYNSFGLLEESVTPRLKIFQIPTERKTKYSQNMSFSMH